MLKLVLPTAAAIFAVDQVLKYWIVQVLDLKTRLYVDVFPGYLHLVMTWNKGINFGFFAGDSLLHRVLIIALAIIICGGVLWWTRRERNLYAQISIGIFIGGAIGNVVDRIVYGAVADFLNVTCCGLRNPFAFNVADIAIFCGALGLIFFASDPKKA
ncbi:MAG: signal peptidase II [Planktomarina sp.]